MGQAAHMLDFFRQKGLTSIVYGAIVVGMILVFVLGFNPTAGKKLNSVSEACAAKVKGSCIEPKAHKAAYRLIFPQGPGGMRQSAASRLVLEGLIERELLIDEAERLGLTVSEDEVTDSIFNGFTRLSIPADNIQMQRARGIDDGRIRLPFEDPKTKEFDMKTYENVVKRATGRSPNEFREWQTRELLAARMRDLVRAPIRVSDDEAFDRYAVERTNAQLNYVVVRRGWLEKYGISADAKDVDAWSKDKTNLAQVIVPVRHVLVKFPGEKPEEHEAAKAKAQGLLDRIKKGEDIAAIAKEFSDDPGSKDKGGQYPGEMVDQFVEPFKKAVAGAKPGELVPELVETSFGYHIIKRDEASKDDVLKAYKSNKSLALSKEVAQKIAADVKAGKSGEEAVNAAIAQYATVKPAPKPVVKAEGDAGAPEAPQPEVTAATDPERPQFLTTSAFNRGGDPIPGMSGEAEESVSKFAFDAKNGDVSEPIRSDEGFVVAQLKERKAATREEFDKERDQYKQGLLAAKQAEALANYVKRLRDAAKSEIKVDENNVFGAKSDAGAAQPEDDEEGP